MTFRLKFGILLLTLLLAGCTHQQLVSKTPADYDAETIPARIKAESDQLARIHKETLASVEKPPVKPVDVTPVMPAYDPLEDRIVSFSLVNEDFKMVLYSLAQAVGMNLIIDPDVKTEEKRLTLNFENVSAAMVLREVLDTFNLFYSVKGNVIRIKPFQEKIFMLNFLDTSIDADFLVGGDVLGETEGLEGLTGSFKLTGKGASGNEGNPYDIVEKMVEKILSPEGKYVLNRMAGTLYVRDRPKSLRSISRFVNHSREVLSRQIHIVARIIEVVLRDEFDYGIDWQVLWSEAKITDDAEATVSWSPEDGLNIQAIIKHFDIDAAIDALQTFGDVKIVSNPNIRAKHGKPALISVGTSISYTKSTSTTILDGIQRDLINDVEVSKVFDGLVLGVIPFIQNSGKITLLINPIKSDVDPESLELVPVGTQQVTLPVVNIKEVSTTITLNSGDAVILGGLIDSQDVVIDRGVPGLSSIPVLGYLFKDQFKREENRELVIILSVSEI